MPIDSTVTVLVATPVTVPTPVAVPIAVKVFCEVLGLIFDFPSAP
jgi:hypothetical protein